MYLASRVRQKLQSRLVILLIICTLSFSNRYRILKIKLDWKKKKKLFRRPTRKSIFLHNKFTSLPNYSGICSRNYFGLFSHFWFFFFLISSVMHYFLFRFLLFVHVFAGAVLNYNLNPSLTFLIKCLGSYFPCCSWELMKNKS